MTAVFIGVGLALFFGVYWYLLARRAKLTGRLQSVPGTLHGIDYRHVRGAKRSSYWQVVTSYDYSVEGKRYEGKRPSLDFNSFSTEANAREVMAGLEPGPVTVWYDPANPSWSALRNAQPQHIGLIRTITLIGVAASVIGGVIALAVG